MDQIIKKQQVRLKIIALSFIILLSITVGLLLSYIIGEQHYTNDLFEHENIESKEDQYETILLMYRKLSNMYYEDIESNDRILEIIYEANTATLDERGKLRNELMDLSQESYLRATNDNIRQYHFVLKDNTSFLRMHKPEKYGDNLTGIRESVMIANEQECFVEGFEEGRIFNGYRFEYPLFYNDECIGCVEISLSFSSVSKLMNESFDIACSYIIKKSIVDEKVFADMKESTYQSLQFTENYYVDKETIYTKENDFFREIFFVNEADNILPNIDSELNGETFSTHIKSEDKTYSFIFYSISNIAGEHAGYLIFAEQNNHYFNNIKSYSWLYTLVIITYILTLGIIFVLIKDRIKIDHMTYYDKLTGTMNRNIMYATIKKEIERKKRYEFDFSIILFDIDDFKSINDEYNHITGDKVLKFVISIVMKNLRSTDIIFRFGGDEFLILLPHINIGEAVTVAEKINTIIKNTETNIISKPVTFSMGVVECTDDDSVELIIEHADQMLYRAKNNGKNRVCSLLDCR